MGRRPKATSEEERKARLRESQLKWLSNPSNKKKRQSTNKKWMEENPEKVRDKHLKSNYGISHEEFQQILKIQNGCCAICKTDKPGPENVKHFHVDHDRMTGIVRGLLCDTCNRGLGLFRDSAHLLNIAEQYIRGHHEA